MTTGIASHRPLPYGEINSEWRAMLTRIASICPIHYSDVGLDTTGDAEVSIDVEYKKHTGAIETILFSNRRLDPLYRYTTDHLITFVCRQRLSGRRELGPWKVRRGNDEHDALGIAPDDSAVQYVYEGRKG